MSAGYLFHLSCLACGGPIAHRADGTSNGTTAQAVADCTVCGWEFVIAVHMQAITKRPVAQPRCSPTTEIVHGTERGYNQHRNREQPIDAEDSCGCRAAHAAFQRDHKRKRRAMA
jgi:hypothetical protein